MSYCIPQDLMRENAFKSATILQEEGIYPSAQVSGKQIDNFTTASMINEAVYPSKNPVVDSLRNPSQKAVAIRLRVCSTA